MGPADPASAPTPDAGAQAQALSQVRTAVQMLQEVLPALQLGSDPHKAVLKAVTDLSKIAPPSSEVPGIQMSQLQKLQQSAQQSAPLQQLAQAMGQGQNVPQVSPQ